MMALVLASAVGVVGTGWIATVIGWTILLSALAVVLVQTRRLLAEPIDEQQHTRSLVIWLLIFFSLLFIGAMAVGRISLGVQMGTVSRYVTLTTPAIVGLYFHLTRMKLAGWRCPLLCVVVIALSVSALCVRPREERSMRWYLRRQDAVAGYLSSNGDISVANRAIGTSIHPRWDTRNFRQNSITCDAID
jgi:hypothetical protein